MFDEVHNFGTFCNQSDKAGDNIMAAVIVVATNINAYMILVDVELRQVGQAPQHSEQAVEPKQHASCAAGITARAAPILM